MEKDVKWLEWAERHFAKVAGEDKLICLDEFNKALNVNKVRFSYFFSLGLISEDFLTIFSGLIVIHYKASFT